VEIELHALTADGARVLVAHARTNADGRTDAPLIAPTDARVGLFELSFHVGAYFRAEGAVVGDPPFLDVVPIRFAISDPKAHYHVPLVVTPWSYSTYRGS
jgi:5-hydroxyisourate hydrolase